MKKGVRTYKGVSVTYLDGTTVDFGSLLSAARALDTTAIKLINSTPSDLELIGIR